MQELRTPRGAVLADAQGRAHRDLRGVLAEDSSAGAAMKCAREHCIQNAAESERFCSLTCRQWDTAADPVAALKDQIIDGLLREADLRLELAELRRVAVVYTVDRLRTLLERGKS